MNASIVTSAFESFDADDAVRTYEPMQRKQRRPEPRRKGHGGSAGGGFQCRRNKHHTWGSGAGARLADLRAFAGAIALAFVGMVASASAAPFDFTWRNVLQPGNAASQSGLGAVANHFQISAYETTVSQYAYFLNNSSAGKTNVNQVWTSNMNTATSSGGISQSGSSGNFTYTFDPSIANRPIVGVSWFSAARFVNWYVNGGNATASSETGTYTLSSGTGTGAIATRSTNAKVWLPSADEWYKAAFYNPSTSSYTLWPSNSNTVPTASAPTATANTANYNSANAAATSVVGGYTNTTSAYGAFDMFGNTKEWTDSTGKSSGSVTVPGTAYSLGASWASSSVQAGIFNSQTSQFNSQLYVSSANTGATLGFRVAAVPEPSNMIAAALGLGGLIAVHMVKRRKLALARVAG